MEVFQAIGIMVSALLIYAVITLFMPVIAARDGEECWAIAWIVGGVGFAIVAYCWIADVPLPVLK